MFILKALLAPQAVCSIARTISETDLDRLAENVNTVANVVIDGAIGAGEFITDVIDSRFGELEGKFSNDHDPSDIASF